MTARNQDSSSPQRDTKMSFTFLRAYNLTKALLALATFLSGEAALLNYDRFDAKTLCITLGMALAVVFIVEAFLIKDAVENLIARGVAAWIRENIESKEAAAPVIAPSPLAGEGISATPPKEG